MKKLALSCLFVTAVIVLQAQNRETRNVGAFTKVSYRVGGNLYLKQGSPAKVELEGSSDVLKEIETEVKDDRLIIGRDRGWRNWGWDDRDRINVYITMPTIEGLSVSGSGNLIANDRITVRDLDLSVSGSGNLQLEFNATGNVEADVSGSGDMDIKGSCNNYDSDVSGSGKVVMTATIQGTADFGVSGSGRIVAQGSAKEVKAGISGSGRVSAGSLVAERCTVRISGSGDVEINVKEELDANITGSGTVTYNGDPKRVNSHASGSGSIRKRSSIN